MTLSLRAQCVTVRRSLLAEGRARVRRANARAGGTLMPVPAGARGRRGERALERRGATVRAACARVYLTLAFEDTHRAPIFPAKPPFIPHSHHRAAAGEDAAWRSKRPGTKGAAG